jgi:D-glycero-D-manno-heptose 1,7-bisphosphate phosphatase
MTISKRYAVFLDRDGVINPLIYHRDAGIVDSPFTLGQFRILPGVPEAIRLFNKMGLAVVVVSNQPGIAKRHFDAAMLRRFDAKLLAALKPTGATIDAIYYCLHHPDAEVKRLRKHCACRKPGTGMLRMAARDLKLTLAGSYMVGDGLSDVEAGSRAGCRTIFIGRWKCEHGEFIRPRSLRPTHSAKSLWEAARIIRREMRANSRSLVQTKSPAARSRLA